MSSKAKSISCNSLFKTVCLKFILSLIILKHFILLKQSAELDLLSPSRFKWQFCFSQRFGGLLDPDPHWFGTPGARIPIGNADPDPAARKFAKVYFY
jgi:hypothetical protein